MAADIGTCFEDGEVMILMQQVSRRHARNSGSHDGQLHGCVTIFSHRRMYNRLGSNVSSLRSRLNRLGK
jgi:hypothetical protein